MRNAQQLIIHKHIQVNGVIVTHKSFTLKEGDLVQINEKIKPDIYYNVGRSNLWPLPPKYLSINYSTFEIIFNGDNRT